MSLSAATEILVQDVMTHDVLCVGPDTTIGEALDLMYEKKVSALPVVDEGDRCFGIVTATDLVVLLRSTEQQLRSEFSPSEESGPAMRWVQKRLDTNPVRGIMSELMVTVAPDVSIQRAAKTMADENVHHLPVITDRQLVGFISSVDIVRAVAQA